MLKAGDMERCLNDLVWHLEDPRVGQSYPNFYVARLASKFVKVVLAGTGGDELFGGYPWRYYVGSPARHSDYMTQYYESWNRLIPPDWRRDCSNLTSRRHGGASPHRHIQRCLPAE